jgi:hypothetical protein
MILDNIFNQAATPPGGAPRLGTGAIIPAGFGIPEAGARRRSLAVRTSRLSSVTLFAAALTIAGRAHADSIPLPLPVESVTACSAPGVCDDDPFPANMGLKLAVSDTVGPDGQTAHAEAETLLTQSPGIIVEISGNNQSVPDDPGASANTVYSFTVIPPDDSFDFNPAPLHVSYSIIFAPDSSSDATYQVAGVVGVFSSTNVFSQSSLCANGGACDLDESDGETINVGQIIGFQPDVVETVGLSASIGFVSATSSFHGTVLIDPTFTIDPAFLQQNPGYSLEFSDGVGDSPDSAPEPASWAMMLIGLGGLGAAMSVTRHSRGFRRST